MAEPEKNIKHLAKWASKELSSEEIQKLEPDTISRLEKVSP